MLEVIKNLLWSLPCSALIIASGAFILIKTRFFIIRHPLRIFRNTFGKIFKNKNAFALACTSLGGTIGVGNAVGVAGAIAEGGAGAVFWMGIAGLFSMAIKYGEIYITLLFKEKECDNGPFYYLEKSTGGRFIPCLYSFLCIAVSLGMGNLSQIKAGINASKNVIPVSQELLVVIIAIIFIVISVGGIKKISAFSAFAVPILSLLYIAVLAVILYFERNKLPSILKDVITGSGVFAGIKWHLIRSGVSSGFSKSVFSTEAGLGSAAFTHGASENSPHAQALWGVVEVFVDTLICILTAFAILSLKEYNLPFATKAVFELHFGKFGAIFYAFSMLTFAFTSVLCWYYIGSCAVKNIVKSEKVTALYFISFSAFIVLSAYVSDSIIIDLSDVANALMMIVNLPAILILSKNIKTN